MKHTIRHGLDQALARKATQRALETYQTQFAEYSPRGVWVTPDHAKVSFTVLKRTLEGQVRVLRDSVELDLDVPLTFRPFQGMAMQVIEREIEQWLARARNGELD